MQTEWLPRIRGLARPNPGIVRRVLPSRRPGDYLLPLLFLLPFAQIVQFVSASDTNDEIRQGVPVAFRLLIAALTAAWLLLALHSLFVDHRGFFLASGMLGFLAAAVTDPDHLFALLVWLAWGFAGLVGVLWQLRTMSPADRPA